MLRNNAPGKMRNAFLTAREARQMLMDLMFRRALRQTNGAA